MLLHRWLGVFSCLDFGLFFCFPGFPMKLGFFFPVFAGVFFSFSGFFLVCFSSDAVRIFGLYLLGNMLFLP